MKCTKNLLVLFMSVFSLVTPNMVSHAAALPQPDSDTSVIMHEVLNQIISEDMTEQDKIKAVHDWLCEHVDYDYSFSPTSYTLSGPILYGQSVCQGYATCFQYYMDLLEIPCETVSGQTPRGGHAWNRILIDNEWSYIDVTWDDFTKDYDYIAYDCFLISEDEMERIHNTGVYHFVNGEPKGYY